MKARYLELDGIRGLAAFTVFLSHAFGMLSPGVLPWYLENTMVHLLWDGAAAVDLFFVLSGFCLALPYVDGQDNRRLMYIEFGIKRVFRIYPTYLVGLVVALLIRYTLFLPSGLEGLSSWVTGLWTVDPVPRDFVEHVLFVWPWPDTHRINPVIWSLIIEMRMSLIFPLFIIFAQWSNKLLISATIMIASIVLASLGHALFFLPLFVAGGLLAKHRTIIGHYLSQLSSWQLWVLILMSLVLYSVRFAIPGWNPDPEALWLHLLVGGSSAVLIVASLIQPSISALMSHRITQFLGSISYSLYLLHLPVLLGVSSLVYPWSNSLLITWGISLVLSILVSYISKKFIEDPSIRWGRHVAPFTEGVCRQLVKPLALGIKRINEAFRD